MELDLILTKQRPEAYQQENTEGALGTCCEVPAVAQPES